MREIFPATIELNLTKRDLEGNYTNPEDCPVARACRRFMKCRKDEVGIAIANDVHFYGAHYTILAAYDFVERWDSSVHDKLLESLKAGKFKGHKITLKRIR